MELAGKLSLSITEKERQDQIKEARRLSQLEVAPAPAKAVEKWQSKEGTKPNQPFKKKFVLKGHDAILKDFQAKGFPVVIESLNGTLIDGVITASDRYTISIRTEGETETIYKHGIFSFKRLVTKEKAND